MTILEDLKLTYSDLKDPRIERNKKHSFLSIIFIVLCAALAGIDDWVGAQDYCEANFNFFKNKFDLSGGIPSHDTIGRVMSRIDIDQFQDCFVSFTKLLSNKIKGVIAIDGKTAKGSNKFIRHKKGFTFSISMVFG